MRDKNVLYNIYLLAAEIALYEFGSVEQIVVSCIIMIFFIFLFFYI